MKIIFLGYLESKVIDFLKAEGNEIMNVGPEEKIDIEKVKNWKPELTISFGYRKIIKGDFFGICPDIINLHISYLPWNGGCDPNFWSFLENTPKGYTIQYMASDPLQGIDSGDIIVQKKADFGKDETLATSYAKLREGIELLFIDNWNKIKDKEIKVKIQNPKEGNYHHLHDIDKYKFILEKEGWNTKVSEISKYGKENGFWYSITD